MLRSRGPPIVFEKICAIPTANEGAPPARFHSVCSPTERAVSAIVCACSGKPHPEIVEAAASGDAPTMAEGLLIAKYTPGGIEQAATMAITPTNDSSNMAP